MKGKKKATVLIKSNAQLIQQVGQLWKWSIIEVEYCNGPIFLKGHRQGISAQEYISFTNCNLRNEYSQPSFIRTVFSRPRCKFSYDSYIQISEYSLSEQDFLSPKGFG